MPVGEGARGRRSWSCGSPGCTGRVAAVLLAGELRLEGHMHDTMSAVGERGLLVRSWLNTRREMVGCGRIWIWEDPKVEGETGWSGGAVMEWMGRLPRF